MSGTLSAADVTKTLAAAGAPTAPPNANKEAVGKLGHRVAQHLTKYREEPEVVFLQPEEVGVAPHNRGGARPNLQVIHERITQSFQKDGYDPARHLSGIVVHFKSERGRKDLLEYNHSWSEGRSGFPRIHKDQMQYGTLAGSHLTLALRCVKQGMVTPGGMSLGALTAEDEKLDRVCNRGLPYVVLQEETPLDAQHDISQWRSQDQNSNLSFHEIELVQSLILAARKEAMMHGSKVSLGPICSYVMRTAPVTLHSGPVASLARYVMVFWH